MRRLAASWGRHFLGCELVTVLVLFVAFIAWAEYFGGYSHIADILKDRKGAIYGTLAAIFGSLLGFAITAESIVLGLSGHERLDIVRSSRHYPTLWRVFTATIRALAVAAAAALVALIADRDGTPAPWALYACVLGILLVIARLSRCVWVLEQVTHLVATAPSEGQRK
ncbi:MAG: hypothetical protein IPM18_09250 [Phycisphaerales bacterium]|nr:hypothetical protein [Phycisphaerales bacterium]